MRSNKRPFEKKRKLSSVPWEYASSLIGSVHYRQSFSEANTFCMFLASSRSGHSLISSLLDAHPNMIVALELGVLKYVLLKFSKNQIFYLLLKRSARQVKSGRTCTGYSYLVPNQWQGRFTNLKIIGDKDGGGTAIRLKAKPWLFKRLLEKMDVGIKVVQVVRNPFDNISCIHRDHKRSLEDSIRHYFNNCGIASEVIKTLDCDAVFKIRYEEFIEDPKTGLDKLCGFFGVTASDDYLNNCAGIVFKSPDHVRREVPWNREQINEVENKIAQFSFLEGYSFQD